MTERKLRILHLSHPEFLTSTDPATLSEEERYACKTDLDVGGALRELGHEVHAFGVEDEVKPIREVIEQFEPDVVFNLVEQFAGFTEFDQHIVAYLELMGVPYTGCNPRGLTLARGKALSKKIAAYHRVPSPRFAVHKRGQKPRSPKAMRFPQIVKGVQSDASTGISQASVVASEDKLAERVAFVHEQLHTDAIAEEFVDGRELYVGVLGNDRLTVLPAWELDFGDAESPVQRVATQRLKHDVGYQKRHRIEHHAARDLPDGVEAAIGRVSRRLVRALSLDGYSRIDYRLDADGRLYFIEANPNPEIAREEEFASAAAAAGIAYPALIQRIVRLGLKRSEP